MRDEQVEKAIQLLADQAEAFGAECEDEEGIVRALVESYGLGFNAWLCVCVELADREARREGFKGTVDRALKRMKEVRDGIS